MVSMGIQNCPDLPSSRLTDSVIAKPTERDSLTRMGRPAYDADLKKRVRLYPIQNKRNLDSPTCLSFIVSMLRSCFFFSGAQAFIQRQIIVLVSRKGFCLTPTPLKKIKKKEQYKLRIPLVILQKSFSFQYWTCLG